MTLVASDEAKYEDGGGGKVLMFQPDAGAYDPPPCA